MNKRLTFSEFMAKLNNNLKDFGWDEMEVNKIDYRTVDIDLAVATLLFKSKYNFAIAKLHVSDHVSIISICEIENNRRFIERVITLCK